MDAPKPAEKELITSLRLVLIARTVNIGSGEIVSLGLSVVGAVEQVLCFLHRGVLSAHAEGQGLLAHEDGDEALRHLQVGVQEGR